MDTRDTLSRVQRVIAEQCGVAFVNQGDSIVADLQADSLDSIEIIMELEGEFEIDLADDDCMKCITVQDVADLVARTIKERA